MALTFLPSCDLPYLAPNYGLFRSVYDDGVRMVAEQGSGAHLSALQAATISVCPPSPDAPVRGSLEGPRAFRRETAGAKGPGPLLLDCGCSSHTPRPRRSAPAGRLRNPRQACTPGQVTASHLIRLSLPLTSVWWDSYYHRVHFLGQEATVPVFSLFVLLSHFLTDL